MDGLRYLRLKKNVWYMCFCCRCFSREKKNNPSSAHTHTGGRQAPILLLLLLTHRGLRGRGLRGGLLEGIVVIVVAVGLEKVVPSFAAPGADAAVALVAHAGRVVGGVDENLIGVFEQQQKNSDKLQGFACFLPQNNRPLQSLYTACLNLKIFPF